MLEDKYDPALATATICTAGTLGHIIPPSISLVLLGDVLGNAYQKVQLGQGILSPKTVSVGDLFAGAMIPGLVLVVLYFFYVLMTAFLTTAKVGGRIATNHRDESPGQSLAKTLLDPIMSILLLPSSRW